MLLSAGLMVFLHLVWGELFRWCTVTFLIRSLLSRTGEIIGSLKFIRFIIVVKLLSTFIRKNENHLNGSMNSGLLQFTEAKVDQGKVYQGVAYFSTFCTYLLGPKNARVSIASLPGKRTCPSAKSTFHRPLANKASQSRWNA